MSTDPALSRPPKSRRRRLLVAAAAFVLAFATFAALFDWDWLRPAVERYLSDRSGREVRAGHLAVEWPFGLEPTVRFTDVHVANAPWAAQRPFVTAREVAFTVRLSSLVGDAPTVVPRLELVDADVDME